MYSSNNTKNYSKFNKQDTSWSNAQEVNEKTQRIREVRAATKRRKLSIKAARKGKQVGYGEG